jgi:hypothetical protein
MVSRPPKPCRCHNSKFFVSMIQQWWPLPPAAHLIAGSIGKNAPNHLSEPWPIYPDNRWYLEGWAKGACVLHCRWGTLDTRAGHDANETNCWVRQIAESHDEYTCYRFCPTIPPCPCCTTQNLVRSPENMNNVQERVQTQLKP